MKKIILCYLAMCLLAFPMIFSSCSENNDSDELENEAGWNKEIIGDWKYDINASIPNANFAITYIALHFIDESKVDVGLGIEGSTAGGGGGFEIGIPYSYYMKGDRIYFIKSDTQQTSEMTYDIANDKLYLSLKSGSNFPICKYPYNDGMMLNFEGPASALYTRYTRSK
ncbi:MAG: hypothetical protein J1E84_02185 [Muribaculaceae bacterium]|nr:hypothetical protein [Muribaculaceae bacterium]